MKFFCTWRGNFLFAAKPISAEIGFEKLKLGWCRIACYLPDDRTNYCDGIMVSFY
ncbi:hypothetical protein [Aerosakkonema funiforme]|uniref:hypothetical protein n=1 Tax=Aerosakkonema funiforme TaxID=1246630 RepID=UPI0035BBED4D